VNSNNFSNYNIINVYNKKSIKSGLVTQILYGEKFKIISKYRKWCKIKLRNDGYKGYIIKKKFISKFKPTHKVCSISAALYSKPLSKYKINNKLSFGSKIKVVEKKSNFYKFDNLWIKKKDLKKISFETKDNFKNINKFVNVKYKWGGKHFTGIDCSGLIQLFLNFNNKFCPRDTKDQIKYFKRKIRTNKMRKNDLIFWKGHVALIVSKKKLIHGYGPLKKVVTMPIKKAITTIYKTTNLKVIGVRRIA